MIRSETLLTAVIERLGEEDPRLPPDLREPVEAKGVLDLDAAVQEKRFYEAVAALGSDVPDAAAETARGAVQIVATTVVVLLRLRTYDDAAGKRSGTRAPLSRLIDRTRIRLLGWRPECPPESGEQWERAASPLTLSRGQLLEIDGASGVWADEYRVLRAIAGGRVTGTAT